MPMVTWDRPMTAALQQLFSSRLQKVFPDLESETLTWTAGGRPVEVLKLGQGSRRVLLTGGHHANETITSLLLWRLLEDYCRGLVENGSLFGFSCRGLFRKSTLYLMPLVNPDGADLTAGAAAAEEVEQAKKLARPEIPFPQGWKANLQGVDLNLNYPARWELAREIKEKRPGPRDFPGRSPLDQPETAALAEYTRQIRPHIVGAWHTQGAEIYADRDDRLARMAAHCSGYSWKPVPSESANAGFRDWFLQEFHRPGFTIEAGRGENPLPLSQLPKLYEENLPIFVLLLSGV